MSPGTNVVRRPGSSKFYARLSIPKDLQIRMGTPGKPKREHWKSLDTSDPREAKRRARPILEAWEQEFDELRRPRTLSESELQDAVWKRYQDLINSDARFRQSLPTEADLDEIWKMLEAEYGEENISAFRIFEDIRDTYETAQRERTKRFAQMRTDVARGETRLVLDILHEVIEERRLNAVPGDEKYRQLGQGLQRAELEFMQRAAERDKADFTGQPKDPLVQPPMHVKRPGETIMELYDRFRKEKPALMSEDTWNQNRKIVALFDDYTGGKSHISELTRKNVRDWKANLFSWPVKATESRAFAGMSFLNTIEANITVGKPTISEKTINRYLSAIGSFSTWLLANDFVKEDVMRGLYLDIDRSEKTIYPYTAEQLKTIFGSPLFSKCGGTKLEHQPGEQEIRDWRYWIPWIALYTGARLGEIAQLEMTDVRQQHGVWIFHITKQSSRKAGALKKSVKTAGSQRVVPIHTKLIEIGLLDYFKAMQARDVVRLFPEIEPDTRGYMSAMPSGFWGDYLKRIGVKVDRSVNAHSFRHTMTDAFRSAGYLDEQFNMLLGHAKGSTTGKYGILPEGILSDRAKMIEAVSYNLR